MEIIGCIIQGFSKRRINPGSSWRKVNVDVCRVYLFFFLYFRTLELNKSDKVQMLVQLLVILNKTAEYDELWCFKWNIRASILTEESILPLIL